MSEPREIKRIEVYLVDRETGEAAEEPVAVVRVAPGQELAFHVIYEEIE